VTLALIGVTSAYTNWSVSDLLKFVILIFCGMVSAAFTPRMMYKYPGLTRDFSTVWVIPIAILLPPVYAMLAPIAFFATLHLCVHRGVPHRTVFTVASVSLPYAAVSEMFRWFPASFAGAHVGTGFHALTWALAVAACEALAGRWQHFLIVGAVKLSDPKVRMREMDLSWQALEGDFLKIDLGVLITLAVAVTPALVIVALPTVFLVRRFLEHPILVAQSRIDAKTGLLNVSTWESEAETELSRAVRTQSSLSVALVDIDHFKIVNDTYGHLVGDKVLKAVAETLTANLRDYDRAGRFGGEEFVLLLAQASELDGCKVAERLRTSVAELTVPVDHRSDGEVVSVTISIGVTALAKGDSAELTDLLAAADSALYYAKQSGRNCSAFAPPQQNMGLDSALTDGTLSDAAFEDAPPDGASFNGGAPTRSAAVLNNHRVVLVQSDQTAVSLCLKRLLSAVDHVRDVGMSSSRDCPRSREP
jgi:diguanylate cyclase (GGDEF)-like protein